MLRHLFKYVAVALFAPACLGPFPSETTEDYVSLALLLDANSSTDVTRHYVQASAAAGGNGLTWETAYNEFGDALLAADSGDEIWVAAGIYHPHNDPGTAAANISKTFTLVDGVTIYGGFAGGETEASARAPDVNRTILSGDIDQNDTDPDTDGLIIDGSSDIVGTNSSHVVTGSDLTTGVTIDGLIITAGDAQDGTGGGCMLLSNSTVNFLNGGMGGCRSSTNAAGIDATATTLNMSQIVILGSSGVNGGALRCTSGSTVNYAFGRVLANQATEGAGFFVSGCDLTVANTGFVGNAATGNGGVVRVLPASNQVGFVNSVMTLNQATAGHVIYSDDTGGNLFLANATLATHGAAGSVVEATAGVTITVHNTIIYGNAGATLAGGGTFSAIASDLAGCGPSGSFTCGTDGGGNLDVAPNFVNGGSPQGGDSEIRTADDGLLLNAGSPVENMGSNALVLFSPDAIFQTRIANGTVDMGAYERQ